MKKRLRKKLRRLMDKGKPRSLLQAYWFVSRFTFKSEEAGFPAITKCKQCGAPVFVEFKKCQECGCDNPTKKERDYGTGVIHYSAGPPIEGYGEYTLDDFDVWRKAESKSFKEMVLELIEKRRDESKQRPKKGKKTLEDPDIYKRGNISRQSFSDLINKEDYTPTKIMLYRYIIALHATMAEALSLFRAAGYEPRQRDVGDVLILWCAASSEYDTKKINEMLELLEKKPLF